MSDDGVALSSVAAALDAALSGDDVRVSDVHHDSRRVQPGSLFVAIRGSRVDGHDVAADAVANGAAGLVVEQLLDVPVPQIVVADTRAALPLASAHVFGHPAVALDVVGVTGTNGKTTVVHFLESIVNFAGGVPGVVGTLGARIAEVPVPLERTTPESSTLQRLLADMVAAEATVAAIEVSSHALALGRVDGIRFDVAAFTNLSQDHLDFHETMDEYFATKAELFTSDRAEQAVIYIDDPWGARLAEQTEIPLTTVGTTPGCDVWVSDVDLSSAGSSFVLHMGDYRRELTISLPGRFNVANAAVAAATALQIGISADAIVAGLEDVTTVPGRLEMVEGPAPFTVVVDYAHTPDAVAAVITDMRAAVSGRIVVVVGAGGGRDQAKRPLMGAAAALADVVVLTSDNPRAEDPATIVAEVAAGAERVIRDRDAVLIPEIDRRLAIRSALKIASEGDAVLILGKGHERGQEFADQRIEPFDDRVVAREEMLALAGAGP